MRAAAGRAEPAPGAIAQMKRRVGIARKTLLVTPQDGGLWLTAP
jgi:hypothetical protein